jgi:hypothetical protein
LVLLLDLLIEGVLLDEDLLLLFTTVRTALLLVLLGPRALILEVTKGRAVLEGRQRSVLAASLRAVIRG